jgi:hypothetical protein
MVLRFKFGSAMKGITRSLWADRRRGPLSTFGANPNVAPQAANSAEKSKANFADRTESSNPSCSAREWLKAKDL